MVRKDQAKSFCSGDLRSFDSVKPYIQTYAQDIHYLGNKVSNAYVLKTCMGYTLVTTLALAGELFSFCESNYFDKKTVRDTLKNNI